MKLTADTITDEQIRVLLLSACGDQDRNTMKLCTTALDPYWRIWPGTRAARERCAEILNARSSL